MLLEFVFQHAIMCGILLCGVLSILLQWIMNLSLAGYVKASANMNTTKKKSMINLKKQYEAMYEMDCHVHNVDAYVEKYILKLRFMGMSFSFWERMAPLSEGVVTLIVAVTAFYTYRSGGEASIYVEIIFSYGVVLACLFLFFHIFGIKSKKQQMQIQLVDYLENYLTNRVARVQEDTRENRMISKEESKQEISKMEQEVSEMKQEIPEIEKEIAASQEKTDVELLEEFVQSFLA